jgi:hypothetical protein
MTDFMGKSGSVGEVPFEAKGDQLVSSDSDEKGTSLVDIEGQKKGIGVAPIAFSLKRSPLEKEFDEKVKDLFKETDLSQSVMFDANAPAKKLVSLDGLPE